MSKTGKCVKFPKDPILWEEGDIRKEAFVLNHQQITQSFPGGFSLAPV
jgi:hypothetical protein